MRINFREENIDRFLSIMGYYEQFYKRVPLYCFKNAPKLYLTHIKDMGYPEPCEKSEADFCIEHPDFVHFDKLFKKGVYSQETFRIMPESDLCTASLSLLKNAVEKLNLNKDQIQNILDLAYIIACCDEKTIKAEHVAESIQYCNLINE